MPWSPAPRTTIVRRRQRTRPRPQFLTRHTPSSARASGIPTRARDLRAGLCRLRGLDRIMTSPSRVDIHRSSTTRIGRGGSRGSGRTSTERLEPNIRVFSLSSLLDRADCYAFNPAPRITFLWAKEAVLSFLLVLSVFLGILSGFLTDVAEIKHANVVPGRRLPAACCRHAV